MKPSSDLPRSEAGAERLDGWLNDWGFEFESELWMERLQVAEQPMVLGRIGAYELEQEISRGGQGVVFRARQPGTKRTIALKRLLAGNLASAGMRQRFEREVEAAALLNHPNIVTVYGMETVGDTPVIAMEWIDGVPPTEWSRGRAPEEILELFLRICDAVQHAHSRGVLHRDLKPSNILVDAAGQPHVLDFGLAKYSPLGGELDDLADLSKSAEVFGTPAYASPEQLDGQVRSLDVRTDVYALGVLLYELLVDESPYGTWDGMPELLRRVGQVRIPRVSARDPRLGSALDTVVRTALAPQREERYRSVELMASDVRRYLAGEEIRAVPLSSWALFLRLVRRQPLVSGLAAALLLLGTSFGIFATVQAARLEEQNRVLEQRARELSSLLTFIPDCVHAANGELSSHIAKPGLLTDRAVGFSSPNPNYDSLPAPAAAPTDRP